MILSEVGEIGIHSDRLNLTLRPSFYAISRLGDPAEIVALSRRIFYEPTVLDAAYIIYTCLVEDFKPHLIDKVYGVIGHYAEGKTEDGSLRLQWKKGVIAEEELIVLAQSLIRHGVIGAIDKEERSSDPSDYTSTFNVRQYVAAAIAHLGASESEAWSMTMTGFVDSMRAKYPVSDEPQESKPLTLEEAERMEAWFDELKKKEKGVTNG